jgi:CRP/FNR family cyclic AMP-dependent transcriptional regulator
MARVDTKLEMLRAVPLFASMRPKDLESLGRLADTIDLPAGKTLMRQGDHGGEMFVISSGSVAVEREGRRVATLGRGETVGEMALLSEAPRRATVTTLEATTVFAIQHREFHTLMNDSAELRNCIFENLAKRVLELDQSPAH